MDADGVLFPLAAAADPTANIAVEFYSAANRRCILTVNPDGVFGVDGGAGNPNEIASFICLLDLQTADGTNYFWSDVAGTYAALIGGGTQNYAAWLRSIGPLRRSRDSRTDAGDIVVQNISGNTVERDVSGALAAREFAGALAVLRIMNAETEAVKRRYDGYLGQPQIGIDTVTFRLRALNDPNRVELPVWDYAEQCQFRYKLKACGSVSALATCPKTFAACVARGVQHRFPGIPILPNTSQVTA